jgi:biotin synthase
LTKESIIDFYKEVDTETLIVEAAKVCQKVHGNGVWLRGLIEFSNYCAQDCLYCGIRRSNNKVTRYRLNEKEILETVKSGYQQGLRSFVLQSGEDPCFQASVLAGIVEKIRNGFPNAAIVLSCGVKTEEEYRLLKKAGADRYLLRFETSDPALHAKLRGGIPLERRLKALSDLKEADYQVGSGYMVGLPGETEKIRIQNALLCAKLELDMAGIGPFIPNPDTPLNEAKQEDIILTIRATALLRLLMPKTHIPATTAAGSLDKFGREKMILAGANVLMPNITPIAYRKHYLLYPGKICIEESGEQCLGCLALRMKSIGREIQSGRGDALAL